MNINIILSWLCFCLFSTSLLHAGLPVGNSIWVYDAIYDEHGKRIGLKPGLFAQDIKAFVANSQLSHRLTQIYSWGGYLKMTCLGSSGTPPTQPCADKDFAIMHQIASTTAYYEQVNTVLRPVAILPTIDGVIGGNNLVNFNTMDKQTAMRFADAVSKVYCADPRIDGVQFDLERYDPTQPGQVYFYMQIAKNFAGKHYANLPDPYHCVDAKHPQGRVFSVFSTSRTLNAETAKILNAYNNGYFISSVYTLGPVTDKANTPEAYKTYASNEIKRMVRQATQYQVKYRLSIPASATMEEFESAGGIPSGYQQLTYIQIVIDAINQYARNDMNFMGIDSWAYSSKRIKREKEYTPSYPPANVLAFLGENL